MTSQAVTPLRLAHREIEIPAPNAAGLRERPLVLVVDDDPGVRLMTEATLADAGFDVIEAADGESGLQEFARQAPDIVLCDVMMPGINGFAVCDALRAREDAANVPIVMLTGLDDVRSIGEAFSRGATDFIVKPITWPLLPHRLRYLARAREAVEGLQRSEQRYALAAAGANDGLWDWDLVSGRVYYSPRWKQMLEYAEQDIGDSPDEWLGRVHTDDAGRVRLELDAHLRGTTDHFQSEHRIAAADGGWRWVMSRGLAVRDAEGRATRMAGSQTDITERKLAEAQLLHDAFHDTLTGLANRTLFLDRMLHCIHLSARRPDFRFAVLFMDLDRFKVVNDSLGHLKGDQLLISIAERLRGCMRAGDTLARLGGDEFTFLFEDIADESVPTRMAERIQATLTQPVRVGDQDIVLSASMGIALNTSGYERAEDMLRDADAAMYRAKDAGRGRYELFDTEMHARALHSLQVESELRLALENDQFEVWYQPIATLEGDSISGFEALVRWRHPTRGLLAPDHFLEVACDTRLVVPLGRRVLATACRQLADWRAGRADAAEWFVSVNLSSQELAQPDLLEYVESTLARTGLPPQAMRLEVTEGSLIENNEHSLKVMQALRSRGIQLSIDDFGTGYSSLNYLRRYPFDSLKIDRSFVADLEQDPQRRDIVQTVITLAHNLGLSVVAEGSEDAATLGTLREMRCEFTQGWSTGKPLPATEMAAFLEERARKRDTAADEEGERDDEQADVQR